MGSIIAYAVSRYRLLSETRMFQLLMLRMVPPIVIVAPLSLYYSYVGLLNSMVGLGVLYFLSSLPYAVWMTKSFIDEVPREVEQAAEILGASRWRTIFEVVLPLIRSGLVATFMFILILNWSEYLLALILSKTMWSRCRSSCRSSRARPKAGCSAARRRCRSALPSR